MKRIIEVVSRLIKRVNSVIRINRESVKDNISFRILFENETMLLGNVYETAYCYNKLTKKESEIFEFVYDPICGLISKNSDWCLVGGETLILKYFSNNTLHIFKNLTDIHSFRLNDDGMVEILIDPWSEYASIWLLEINKSNPLKLEKIRDFKEYTDKPYT